MEEGMVGLVEQRTYPLLEQMDWVVVVVVVLQQTNRERMVGRVLLLYRTEVVIFHSHNLYDFLFFQPSGQHVIQIFPCLYRYFSVSKRFISGTFIQFVS